MDNTDVLVADSFYLNPWAAKRAAIDFPAFCAHVGGECDVRVTRAGPISRYVSVRIAGTSREARWLMAHFRHMVGHGPPAHMLSYD